MLGLVLDIFVVIPFESSCGHGESYYFAIKKPYVRMVLFWAFGTLYFNCKVSAKRGVFSSTSSGLSIGGAAPALIQWQTGTHPAHGMQNKGCRLVKLELLHPEPERLRALKAKLNFSESDATLAMVAASAPGLVAHIDTPLGLRTIGANRPTRT